MTVLFNFSVEWAQNRLMEIDPELAGEFEPPPQDTLSCRIAEFFAVALTTLKEKTSWGQPLPYLQPQAIAQALSLPNESVQQNLRVILLDNDTAPSMLSNPNCVGQFQVSACDFFDAGNQSVFTSEFRVLIQADSRALLQFAQENRKDSRLESQFLGHLGEDWQTKCDQQTVQAFLTTLTHEIRHALDFAQHAHGMPPEQAVQYFPEERSQSEAFLPESQWHLAGQTPALGDLCFGTGCHSDLAFDLDDEDLDYLMEQRVESQARDMMRQILKDPACNKAFHAIRGALEKRLATMELATEQEDWPRPSN